MANKRIIELPDIGGALDAADLLVIEDVSATTTKRMTVASLSAALAPGAATAREIWIAGRLVTTALVGAPAVAGRRRFIPAEHYTPGRAVQFRVELRATGGATATVKLWNRDDAQYVTIGVGGATELSTTDTAGVELRSDDLRAAAWFGIGPITVYEVQVYTDDAAKPATLDLAAFVVGA